MPNRSLQLAATAQRVLEGIPLPVRTEIVVEYAQRQHAPRELLDALRALPKRKQFLRLDDIGEALAPVQPAFAPPDVHTPEVQSDKVPGGLAYTDPSQEPGWIRDEPEILDYEEQLVREPADKPGEGVPASGDRAPRPV